MSTYPSVVISPETNTTPVVTRVSHATRLLGSLASIASKTASLIWSASLSGCPSVTDSDENRWPVLMIARVYRRVRSPARTTSLGAGLSPRAREPSDEVAHGRRELRLRPRAHRYISPVGDQNRRLVRLASEPRAVAAHGVGHERIEVFAPELRPTGLLHVVGLRREAHEELTGPPPLPQLGQDVRGRFEHQVGDACLFLHLR